MAHHDAAGRRIQHRVEEALPDRLDQRPRKARVFVTSLGHNTEMMADRVYQDLVTRGLLWTVGKLKDDGTPAAGYAAR